MYQFTKWRENYPEFVPEKPAAREKALTNPYYSGS